MLRALRASLPEFWSPLDQVMLAQWSLICWGLLDSFTYHLILDHSLYFLVLQVLYAWLHASIWSSTSTSSSSRRGPMPGVTLIPGSLHWCMSLDWLICLIIWLWATHCLLLPFLFLFVYFLCSSALLAFTSILYFSTLVVYRLCTLFRSSR